ncbi:unnamed protein product [Linum tenue]|uniref:Uncharacterized protein n=1 Tax=Linum tenue TaxID=586396 RepID=A0AAV0II01_9ROSI|nr:unnamed protein product [Linum tenue]
MGLEDENCGISVTRRSSSSPSNDTRRRATSLSQSSSPSLLMTYSIIVIFLINLITIPCNGDVSSQQQQPKALLTKMASDTVSVLKESYRSSWDKVKTVIRDIQLQFSSPNLDFRSEDPKVGREATKDRVIGAVEKSVEVGEYAAEETAEAAAKVVETTVQMTTNKVKGKKSNHEEL